ncbi:MAG: ABC transporter permease [Gracilibacteraceae bacterium]|jgi:ribose transport system permease protein|nr:ABC transporter permease [Gracilibacteraceae bacterium]
MESKRKNVLHQVLSIRGMGQVVTVSAGLLVLCVIFGALNPNFYSGRNIANLLRQIAPFIIVGIGQSYVLITGNIDLSIGSVLGMSCMISATLMTKGVNPWAASLITMIACIMVGFINGGLVSGFKLPPFIATLGTMTVARGIAQLVNNNMNTDAIGESANGFRNFFYYGKTLSLYNTVWVALALWLVFNFILSQTKVGRHIYAIGSNIEAAKLSGVNTAVTTTIAYIVSAFCAGVTGLITCATGGLGTMDAGTSYELYAVAASVIGGVSTLGGQGILLGTIVGACVWGVMQNGLQFVGAPVALRNIVIGIIVIVSVLADVIVRSGKGKKSITRFLGVSLKIK